MGEWVDTRKATAELMADQLRYASQIGEWLDRALPDVDRHPAAVAAVIRLHAIEGKGRLTARQHGAQIRAAVQSWQQKWGDAAAPLPEKETQQCPQ